MIQKIILLILIIAIQACTSNKSIEEVDISTPSTRDLSLESSYKFTKSINSKNDIYGIRFHPKKDILISYGDSNTITLYNSKSLEPIKLLISQNSELHALAISSDGNYLAIGGDTGGLFSSKAYIEIWDLNSYKRLHTIDSPNQIYTLAFSPDNSILSSGGEGKKIYFWSLKTAKKLYELESQSDYAFEDDIIHISFINNEKLISVSKKKKIEKWDITSQKLEYSYTLHIGDIGKINKVKVFDRYIALALIKIDRKQDDIMHKWRHLIKFNDYRGGEILALEQHKRSINSFDISKDFRFMVSTSNDKSIKIYDLEKRQLKRTISLDKIGKDISIDRNNNSLAVLEGDRTIKTWKIGDSFSLKKENSNLQESKDRYAIVVAIDYYKNSSITPLNNAVEDARKNSRLLKSKGFRVLSLYNEDATKSNIVDAIRKIRRFSKDRGSVLFYFSGHGDGLTLKNGVREGYILPYDFNSGLDKPELDLMYYDEYAISIRSLVKHTMDAKAKYIGLVLDSCFSGLAMNAYPLANRVNILTAGKDQPVSDGSEHSPFTKSINQKLEENPQKCSLTFIKLAEYVSQNVKKETANKQEPQYKIDSIEGENFCF